MTALRAEVTEIVLERALRRAEPRGIIRDVEKEARYTTWMRYMKRNRGRLFDPGPHVGNERRHWDAMNDAWFGKAIGCVPILDGDYVPYDYETAVLVGVFLGVQHGHFGSMDFVVGSFSGPGVAVHRSPLNIEYVCVLGGAYQKIIDYNYRDEDEDDYVED